MPVKKIKQNPQDHIIELGTESLNRFQGFIKEAYTHQLTWPTAQPLYNRIRRSDPEIAVVRNLFSAMTRRLSVSWELPDDANDDEKRARDFAETVLVDMEGGIGKLIETFADHVPFFGWGWWEVLDGIRSEDWRAPDGWRSEFDDGLFGIRRMAFRDSSTFKSWKFDDNGRLTGMVQAKELGQDVTLPLSDSLHVTYGDANNPEGLSPLEAVWRLERIKYGLEIIQGIGYEHAAGYLSVKSEQQLTDLDRGFIEEAAKNIMTATEGNYAVWPKNVTGEIVDVNFTAANAISQAIKYYGILKLTIYNSQWVALSAVSGSGSFAAMDDSSSMFLITYNAMMAGLAKQFDDQVGKRLFELNALAFPEMKRRPTFKIDPISKAIGLAELGSFIQQFGERFILGDDDIRAIRQRSGILPEAIPDQESEAVRDPETPAKESPKLSTAEGKSAFRKYLAWARENDPDQYKTISQKLRR